MQKEFVTNNSKQTQELGEMLSRELQGGEVVCLTGELGGGKTTFTQGMLKGLEIDGPYTSPTFLIMKEYKTKTKNIYHIDAYRIGKEDILNLGFEEIISNPKNIVIIEWADKVSDIIPKNSLWIDFEWVDENERKITVKNF